MPGFSHPGLQMIRSPGLHGPAGPFQESSRREPNQSRFGPVQATPMRTVAPKEHRSGGSACSGPGPQPGEDPTPLRVKLCSGMHSWRTSAFPGKRARKGNSLPQPSPKGPLYLPRSKPLPDPDAESSSSGIRWSSGRVRSPEAVSRRPRSYPQWDLCPRVTPRPRPLPGRLRF
jgi:hypothetical protein